ncbi:zinc finger protein ZXDC isoform X2 [Austrofundulus limnaeus]|uniref:Zinc finger protein ZXDC isoform X2 n=1 Tax=Austrofundulus limnaeus TaxID=52670 RepID=A0A2I4CAN2_AUSLI|nr:PREDICTED: zinc finger protein ZXDC-like isoform X2 [Austrofundulus limnaeus]
MEIQGLGDAQNTQCQHGVLHNTTSSAIGPTSGLSPPLIPTRDEADRPRSESSTGPRTAPFRLLVENSSNVASFPPVCRTTDAALDDRTSAGLHNINPDRDSELSSLLGSSEFGRTGWRYVEGGESVMALPLFEGEEELTPQRQLALASPPSRRQQPLVDRLKPGSRTSTAGKQTPDLYLVFNSLQEHGAAEARTGPPDDSCEKKRGVRGEGEAQSSEETSQTSPMETGDTREPADNQRALQTLKTAHPVFSLSSSSPAVSQNSSAACQNSSAACPNSSAACPNSSAAGQNSSAAGQNSSAAGQNSPAAGQNSSAAGQNSSAASQNSSAVSQNSSAAGQNSSAAGQNKQACHHTVEDVVLTNKYGDRLCGQICTQNSEGKLQLRDTCADDSTETVSTDKPEQISNSKRPEDRTSPVTASPSLPASETFTGTITINNQSIIVTIENGILTLAAPPEGYVHKEDGMVSLKEHLGMKDHEDIVLLNYDSGTKSIGKISTLAVASPKHQDESRPGLSVSDSELALVDDCSFSELSTSLHSCPSKEDGEALCALTEPDLVSPSPRTTVAGCDSEDRSSLRLSRPKKGAAASFLCPEPGCSCTFESRQKLKVHLLNHTEDPRPYQCSVEGCGWAFATSYKLKRHLQSHDKQRPHACQFEGCGRRFTTVYNLKAHLKVHEQDSAFVCDICNEKFRSSTRLTNHQRVHFEPQRPHKCEFPGCEKTFITFSALFSHNRTHFRETGHFACTYPGCHKTYDKACRLKIHMRSHTGERPFVCDSEGCGWSFTSMSKLLRHKRKHEDDRRFVCTEEGCGKSFTRAEHLKGHSITHLGTRPFQCHAEGCNAKFSARSSLYIHSKKHKQDSNTLRTRCPVANCSKHFLSRSSLKSHMVKHHHLSADVLCQMETTPTLTPSSELVSSTPASVAGSGVAVGDQLTNLDLASLFSSVPGGSVPSAGLGVGIPVAGSNSSSSFTMDLSLVSSGILTIDPSSGGTTLVTSSNTTLAKALDPLIMATSADIIHQHGLERAVGEVLPPQGSLNLDDVQTITPEALGTLTALTIQGGSASVDPGLQHPLSSSSCLSMESSASLAVAPVPELLASPSKVVEVGVQGGAGPLLGCVEVLAPQEGGKVLTQFVFPSPSSSFSPQKDPELAVSPSSFLGGGGSARTDYRAIQLVKKKKQRGSSAPSGTVSQRKTKGSKVASAPVALPSSGARYSDGAEAAGGGLTWRDPVTGAQYVQVQMLQDDPATDGDLAFQLSSQPSSSHSQLIVDLPVNILQDTSVMTDDNGSDTSQFTGSTINLQDLE